MSMIEAYKIGVELVMGGDLAQGIAALIPGLEHLDAHITHANAEAKGLSASLSGIGRTAAGIGRAAEAMERLHRATAAAHEAAQNYHATPFVAPHMPRMPRQPSERPPGEGERQPSGGALSTRLAPNFTMPGGAPPDAAFFDEAENGGRIPLYPNGRRELRPEGGERTRHNGASHVNGAFDDVLPMLMGGELLHKIFDASFDVGAKESALLTNGWTTEQVSKARALAQQLQVVTPGASIGGALDVVKDLGVLFRKPDGSPDADTAMGSVPGLLRDALLLAAHGHGDGIVDIFKAAQAGDLKGELSKPGTDETDPKRLTDFVNDVVLADRVTGGRVTPSMILQNIRTGGVAAAMMDNREFFGANLALLEGMGSQAASALSGFNRQFGAGRMGQGVAAELEGVFPALKGHWHSVGMGQVMVDPGAMGDPQQLAQHPLEFIKDTLMPGIDKLIRARTPGFDAMNPDQKLILESQEGSRIAASVTGSRAVVEVMRLWPQMVREQRAVEQGRGTDLYGLELANNPQVRTKALGAAWNAFEVSLGEAGQEPAIKALNAVTDWLNTLAKWAKDNPEGGKAALEGLSFGILALGAAKVKDALVGLGAGGKGGLFMLAGGILALSGAMDKVPSWLADVAKGAALGGTFGGVPGAVLGGGAGAWDHSPGGTDPNSFWNDPHYVEKHLVAPFRGGPGDLPNGGAFTPMAYHPAPGAGGTMLHSITYVQIDGRTIAHAVTKEQLRMMGRQVSGTLRPDRSISPQYGAHLLEL